MAKLPEGMSLDYGAMIEPSAVGAHASNRTDVKGKNVVVSGAGTIGNLIAQFCIARGAKNVLITDVSDLRLAKARECGIKHTLNITKKTLKEAAQELFGEEGYQVGFEVAGVEVSIRSLMETIEKGSDIVVVAVFAKDPALSTEYPDVSSRPRVIVVGEGPGGLFASLRLIELGYRPIVLERGKDVRERKKDLSNITKTQKVDGESNYCFGEGAGITASSISGYFSSG